MIGDDKRLLIVGGGAAGAAAAARANRYEIPSVLVEANDYLFFRQDRCPTRWISPTQYDWPARHASRHEHPWDNSAAPNIELSWSAKSGEELTTQWTMALMVSKIRLGKLDVLIKTTFSSANVVPTPAGFRIEANVEPARDLEPFALVIFATGLGEEQCSLNGHTGPAFWEADQFQTTGLGISRVEIPRVLVSGSGDGALSRLYSARNGSQISARRVRAVTRKQ